jgi:hypothetical protein
MVTFAHKASLHDRPDGAPVVCAGGTFALYSLIARHAQIPTPNLHMVTTADMALSRYTSNQNVDDSTTGAATAKPKKTLGERVRAARACRTPRMV